jgi:hypothetical protein
LTSRLPFVKVGIAQKKRPHQVLSDVCGLSSCLCYPSDESGERYFLFGSFERTKHGGVFYAPTTMTIMIIPNGVANLKRKNWINGTAGVPDGRAASRNATRTAGGSYSLDTVAQMDISAVDADVFSRYLVKQIKRSGRLAERQESKRIFERKLRRFGFVEQADKLKKCSANFTALVCANGHSFRPIVDYRCHLPFCADCWETKSHRELSRMLPKVLQAIRDDPSLILAFSTLTLRSDKARALRGGCKRLKADFKGLRERKIWQNCTGGYGRIENTFSSRAGWHPHLHSLLLLKDYIPQRELSAAWNGVTKGSMVVDIRTVKDVAAGLVECIKYPFKPADMRRLGKAEIAEMLDLKGERLGLSFGALFGIETDDDIDATLESDYAEFAEQVKVLEIGDACPICQTKLDLVDFGARDYARFLGSIPVSASARGKPNIAL